MSHRTHKALFASGAALAALALPGAALAQVKSDISPALPHIMLLLDTSGSMETKPDGTWPYCSVRDKTVTIDGNPSLPSNGGDERSKWISLVEVLTGNFTTYKCGVEGRATQTTNTFTGNGNGQGFQSEFQFLTGSQTASSADPYDYLYFLPYHRFVSQASGSSYWCSLGPDKNGSNSWATRYTTQGTNGIFWVGDTTSPGFRNYAVATTAGNAWAVDQTKDDTGTSCLTYGALPQDSSGILDTYATAAKFGMMAFDSQTDASTGNNDGTGGHLGQWSYYKNWYTGGIANCTTASQSTPSTTCDCANNCCGAGTGYFGCAVGKPNGCTTTPTPMWEVGARNAAAPPWEGRMIGFGSDSAATIAATNARIQKALMTLRPYGATPTEGLLQDAETFWTQDQMPDYANSPTTTATTCGGSTSCFGPYNDPYVGASAASTCRTRINVLLTDGSPNVDMHPWCDSQTGSFPGVCPYGVGRYADTVAAEMAYNYSSLGLSKPVYTYVVGFSPSAVSSPIYKPCPNGNSDCTGLGTCSNGTCTAQWFPSADCSALVNNSSIFNTSTKQCDPSVLAANPSLQVCCDLAKLAYAGSGYGASGYPNAFYASSASALQTALSSIVGGVAVANSSRTPPVFANGYTPSNTNAGQYQFNSSFKVNPGTLWSGVLERYSTVCNSSGVPTDQTSLNNGSGSTTNNGDDFAQNVNNWKNDTAHPRRFFSAYPTTISGNYYPAMSMRWPTYPSNWPTGTQPMTSFSYATPADGVLPTTSWRNGTVWFGYSSTTAGSSGILTPSTTSSILASIMNVSASKCAGDVDPSRFACSQQPATINGVANPAYCPPGTGALVPVPTSGATEDCAKRVLNYALALPQSSYSGGGTTATPPANATALGAIYRSTPVVVGPPGDNLTEPGYAAYAASQFARPIMLYTQTTDGQLHAFKVDQNPNEGGTSNGYTDPNTISSLRYAVRGSVQNEVWSFIPPAVLPALQNMYANAQQFLLDGPVVVKDVRWPRLANATGIAAASSGGSASDWKRVIVASFGLGPGTNVGFGTGVNYPQGGGYYAVDVTDWANPVMLWQLTSTYDSSNGGTSYPLFGTGAAPAITQLYFNDPQDGYGEYPVAILSGGASIRGSTGSGSACTRSGAVGNYESCGTPRLAGSQSTNSFCYAVDDPSRSLTIVRLDTGAVVRTFRPYSSTVTSAATFMNTANRVTSTGAPDFPITGSPAVYPSGTGQLGNRVFVGDAEGEMWRVDLSNPSPASWTMKIWYDAYNTGVCPSGVCTWNAYTGTSTVGTSTSATMSATNGFGQPIQTAPVLSVDRLGNLTVAFSTGDQNDFSAGSSSGQNPGGLFSTSAPVNWVVSLTEQTATCSGSSCGCSSASPYWSQTNWRHGMTAGERVSGALSLFNSTLYYTSILPASTSACASSTARLYGVDYLIPATTTTTNGGGFSRFSSAYTDLTNGATQSNGVQAFGASIRSGLSCLTTGTAVAGGYGTYIPVTASSSPANQYTVVVETGRGTGNAVKTNATTQVSAYNLSNVAKAARLDAWAVVIE